MKLFECKVGDWVKVPLSEENRFTYNLDEKAIPAGRYLVGKILWSDGWNTTIAWKEPKNGNPDSKWIKRLETISEFSHLYPDLTDSIQLASSINVELAVAPNKLKETKPVSATFLLTCIGIGGALANWKIDLSPQGSEEEKKEIVQ